MHTYTHTLMHVCLCMYIHAYPHACLVDACTQTYLLKHACYRHIDRETFILVYLYTHIHT